MDPGAVPAELQGLTEIEEMFIARAFPIMCVYRKHGGQRGYKGHVLNLPQDIQRFLGSLPVNVSDLPVLIIRKRGACMYIVCFNIHRSSLHMFELYIQCVQLSLLLKFSKVTDRFVHEQNFDN